MYKCNDCGAMFNNPDTDYELHSEVDTRREEKYDCCPGCGSIDFDKMVRCELCGEWTDDELCEVCAEDLSRMVSQFIETVEREVEIDFEKAVDVILQEMERRA